MSVELLDTNGSLGQAATNTGFSDAREAVEAEGHHRPEGALWRTAGPDESQF